MAPKTLCCHINSRPSSFSKPNNPQEAEVMEDAIPLQTMLPDADFTPETFSRKHRASSTAPQSHATLDATATPTTASASAAPQPAPAPVSTASPSTSATHAVPPSTSTPTTAPADAPAPQTNTNLPFVEPTSREAVVFSKGLFRNPIYFETFLAIFSCTIMGGSLISFQSFSSYPCSELFEFQNWLGVLSLCCPVYPILCRLFYANLRPLPADENNIILTTHLFRRLHCLTPESVALCLDLSNSGLDIHSYNLVSFPYPDGHSSLRASQLLHGSSDPALISSVSTSDLLPFPRILANIPSHFLLPKYTNRGKLTGCHKLFVYCLMAKLPVNLPLFICRQIASYPSLGAALYGYGKLITKFCHSFGVDLSLLSPQEDDSPFASKNILLMGLPLFFNPEPSSPAPPPASLPPPASSPPPTSSAPPESPPATLADLEALEIRLNMDLHDMEKRMITMVADLFRRYFGERSNPPSSPQ